VNTGPVAPILTDARRSLLEETVDAIVGTIQPDGRPQMTPNWYLWDGEAFVVSTLDWTVKVRNVRLDDRVTVCIDPVEKADGRADYVQVFGRCELIEGDVREGTMELIRKYRHTEAEVVAHWERVAPDRLLMRIVPQRWQWRFEVTG
jgi:PPOX class probable F420-dependent enzyme